MKSGVVGGLDVEASRVRWGNKLHRLPPIERYVELRNKFRPRARLQAVFDAIERSEELLHLETLAEVVSLYDDLDRDLAVFEENLPAAIRAFDAMVERQIT